jgi:hypothetical protein
MKRFIQTVLGLLLGLFGMMFFILCLRQVMNGINIGSWLIHAGQAIVLIVVGAWLIPDTAIRDFWDRTFSK